MNKERPIIFSTPMVQKILAGNKTQTRRVIRGVENDYEFIDIDTNPSVLAINKNGDEYEKVVYGLWATFECDEESCQFPMIKSPYQVGDLLWVCETFLYYNNNFHYRADSNHIRLENIGIRFNSNFIPNWKPSIYMPREAARIFLRLTDVRAERIQDISSDDAQAEGFNSVLEFAELWDKLNAKRGYGWEANPWVWVITFEMEAPL